MPESERDRAHRLLSAIIADAYDTDEDGAALTGAFVDAIIRAASEDLRAEADRLRGELQASLEAVERTIDRHVMEVRRP